MEIVYLLKGSHISSIVIIRVTLGYYFKISFISSVAISILSLDSVSRNI